MTGHGDDCYFFYYSTCSKGDDCPFRHCEAAMGNETVCGLWREGRCFRAVCKFRHMEILKNRKEIPCYWEKQPAGCQKPHCAFFHQKPRYTEGEFIPPNKSVNWMEEQQQQQEEPAPPPPTPLPTAANPQLRGVIKTETQELVPSPTHPPVVINPADDDEDEDDQFSEDGEDGRLGPSPRKLHKSDDSLNIGVSTWEEIRLRRALKASMRRAGYPIQSPEASANGEKENLQSSFRPALINSRDVPSLLFEEAGRPRGNVAARLGAKILTTDVKSDGLPLKRSLAQRLGGVVEMDLPSEPAQKVLKTMKERLGPFSVHAAPAQRADTSEAPQKVQEQIRIKTLEEIRQEKARHQGQRAPALLPTPEITLTRTSSVKGPKQNKRSITIKHSPISTVKTVSKTLLAKKKKQEDELNQSPSPKKAKSTVESQEPSDTAAPPQETPDVGRVRVKTLQEIRREKAARLQVQQAAEADVKKSSDSKEESIKRPLSLRLQKLPGQSKQTGKVTPEKTAEETVKPVTPAAAPLETTVMVKVKSFEEIMREKRMRMQEEKTKGAVDEVSPQNGIPAAPLKKKLPAKIAVSSAGSSPAPVPESPQKSPVPKPAVKSESASPSVAAAVASVPVKLKSSPQTPDAKSQRKNLRISAPPRAALQDPSAGAPDITTKHSVDTKVRPKLNVKPSVMKPAVQLKPGQKRKGAKRSAVAAVKPLNSSSTVQETACRHPQVLESSSAKAQLSSTVPDSPSSLLEAGSTSGPLRKKLQTISITKKSQSQESQPAAKEACDVPQSPVLKSPTQPKSRRSTIEASRSASTAASSSSAVDDFDELINEFTDDHLEGYMDLSVGEDDLLQELSEMIDS